MTARSFELLHVEDDPDDVSLFRRAVEQTGLPIKLFAAFTAEQAYRYLRCGPDSPLERPPDLMVLDLHLPGINGLDLLQALKENEKARDTAIVVRTGSDRESDMARARELGIAAYSKKGNYAEVKEMIKDVYERWSRGEVANQWCQPGAEMASQA